MGTKSRETIYGASSRAAAERAADVADTLRQSHDPRIKYIISNRRIANFQALDGQPAFAWRAYGGQNPHTKHFHISVKPGKTGPGGYDTTTDWSI